MRTRIEKDGYSAELTDELEIVFYGRSGRPLKKMPRELKGERETVALHSVRRVLEDHLAQCRARAGEWAEEGAAPGEARVPRALADADPAWRLALEEADVTLVDEVPDENTADADADGTLWARTYTGPFGLVRTQLLAEDLVPYRDTLMRADGWEPEGGLLATGVADPSGGELPFPERALAAHPEHEALALEKIRALRHETAVWSQCYKQDVDKVLKGLDQTAPALLVTLLDGLADLGLRTEDLTAAAAWFGRARKTERLQPREPDQTWLDARYLTFARGGALSATALRDRARELVRTPAGRAPGAVDRFVESVLARLDATGELYPQLATDLRNMAKAAGLDPEETLAGALQGIVRRERMSLHDADFWESCFKGRAMELLRARGTEAAHAALDLHLRPWVSPGAVWRTLLDRTGALAMLTGDEPGLDAGEAARWLSARVRRQSNRQGPPAELYEIAELIAPRLKADGVPVEFPFPVKSQRFDEAILLDLVDLLLEHGAPVCDPPEALGPAYLPYVTVNRRPALTHVLADERYARELGARARLCVEMRDGAPGGNSWYQPHESKGWGSVPALFDNPVGHEEIRAWSERERERLRAGVGFQELVLLLGRYVHVGAAVPRLLASAEAAAEFAAVDVLPLLTAELDRVARASDQIAFLADFPRDRLTALLDALEPNWLSDVVRGPNRGVIIEKLPELGAPETRTFQWAQRATEEAFRLLVAAANCRAGLAGLVRRLTPEDAPGTAEPAPAPVPEGNRVVAMCEELRALAASSGEPEWNGDPRTPTARMEVPAVTGRSVRRADGTPNVRDLRAPHANAPVNILRTAVEERRAPAFEDLRAYAAYPAVAESGKGRWRVVVCEQPDVEPRSEGDATRVALKGCAYRTAGSAALVLEEGPGTRRVLLEHAPGGVFAEGGPLAASGATLSSAYVLEPVRPAAWFARFVELYEERGKPPVHPEGAVALSEGTGLTAAEAAHLLSGFGTVAPYQAAEVHATRGYRLADIGAWNIGEKEAQQASDTLAAALPADRAAALVERLIPDEPETLWTSGPDVARAVAWWREEHGAPAPAPPSLLPLALKETAQPEGEDPRTREWQPRHVRIWDHSGRIVLRTASLLGRVAAGDACLAADTSGLTGEGGRSALLALPRAAAWSAYRTPAGDPLRTAVGAAIVRLREELAAGPGPLRLFSLQSNHLMGAPPSLDGLAEHEAVTVTEDATYDVRHLLVDPALLKGADDPLLDALDVYLDGVLPSQWLPASHGLPALADLRLLLDDGFAALGTRLSADAGSGREGWEQHPARSVPHLVAECAARHGLDEDAAALYLMLLALPDPTDRNVKLWTGWKPARFKAACAALDSTGLVLRGSRPRAGRSLFLPGVWQEAKPPRLPVETAKRALLPLSAALRATAHMAAVPSCPVPELFARAWERETGGARVSA